MELADLGAGLLHGHDLADLARIARVLVYDQASAHWIGEQSSYNWREKCSQYTGDGGLKAVRRR